MQYREFGKLNWKVSEIGYGMWGMGSWGGQSEEESLQSLQYAIDLGCNFLDSAWVYGQGKADQLAGKIIKDNPNKDIYYCSKVPPRNYKWPSRREDTLDDCYPPEQVEKYTKQILESSGLEKIDLLLLHTWEDSWLKDERWLQKLVSLREQGLVSGIGVSLNRWEPWNGVEVVKSGVIDAVEAVYNIFDQDAEDELLPACQQHNVAVIARVPFDEGSLLGNLSLTSTWPEGDFRNMFFTSENLKESVKRADALKIAIPAGTPMAEIALRFILSHPAVTTVIPGMRRTENIKANMLTSDKGKLDERQVQALRMHRWDRTRPRP